MLEDNVREKGAIATDAMDKKQRWLNIAYKLACVLLAVLSVVALILMAAGPRVILWYDNVYWLDAIIKSLLPAVMVAAVVVALVNLKKETPKLLMLFGGSVGFWGAYLTAMGWTSGLLLVVAGLAVLVVMYMRLELLYREEPVAKVKSKMLVIAGVLSVLVALVQIAYAVFIAMVFGSNRTPEVSTAYFFVGLIYLAGSVGLAAACFAKNHRASVYYRMFFLGVMVVMTALMAGNVLFTLQLFGLSFVSYIVFIAYAAVLAVLVLVLVHTIRTRKQPAALAEAADEAAEQAGAAEEAENTDEEENDDFDDTIGLYREDDDQ